MFTKVQIENYKSIQNLKINLGRVNVFIGENGCGKSNILEAIALASAAAADKLDNEFLAPRGIRVTEPEFMRSAFDKENITKDIKINLKKKQKENLEESNLQFIIQHDNQPYSNWLQAGVIGKLDVLNWVPQGVTSQYEKVALNLKSSEETERIAKITQDFFESQFGEKISYDAITYFLLNLKNKYIQYSDEIKHFIIYSPENSLLRIFAEEGQVQPLGIKGEGLLKLLRVLNNNQDKINEIKQRLNLIDWFDDFKLSVDSELERIIQIKDRYLDKELPYFNQRSSNEGFLFLMFYFALFVSDDTPKFFAIDNIENALNPKLCTRLIQELVELAKKYDKQVIFTTHNPAILDGLDLSDDEQKLFVIYRNMDGHTQARRIAPLEPLDDDEIAPLSEAFINGYIGGLPKNF
ncbi:MULTISPECIES: AAA family ATPase [Pseudanabaena]|jgi:predicted ATPase|uniref:AAA family ATPase n=1 Tax=Pseudanabaena TaxID=1152 RepID=UPI0024790B25|nr:MULTISPECIES: ATP-binding protein [Pseudanabaena]MEA5487290.1 AAA family ATPase [Pseudanabaena sp. CCNP1317]WGS70507.1 AAA family ATPase [Pseudanabaena galeata CCNP1313]